MGVKRRRCRDCVRVDLFFLRDLDVTTGVTECAAAAAAAPSDVVVEVEISVA